MRECIVVEYLLENKWVFSRDFTISEEFEALEHGRQRWRQGVAGVRISRFTRGIIEEHRR